MGTAIWSDGCTNSLVVVAGGTTNAGGSPGGDFSGSLLVVITVCCPACPVGCGNAVPMCTWGGALTGGALIGGSLIRGAAYPAAATVGCAFTAKFCGLVVIPSTSVLLAGTLLGGNFAGGACSFGGGGLARPCASRIVAHSANVRCACCRFPLLH